MARAAGGRITVVRADGKVLVDSEANAAGDGESPHAAGAGAGVSRRIGVGHPAERHHRCVISVRGCAGSGRIGAIRIAVPLAEINRQVSQIRGKILVSTALAFLPAILIAAVLAR
jgi:two-component system phosphate regulon sensor histidine kinase PhoR